MKRLSLLAVLAVISTPSFALSDLERFNLAASLGDILASEELCELAYDPAAIEAYVEKSVPADDLAFSSTLRNATTGQSFSIEQMSSSAKAAHCAQVRRVAKSYGFTK